MHRFLKKNHQPFFLLPPSLILLSSEGWGVGWELLWWGEQQIAADELDYFHAYLDFDKATMHVFAIGFRMICLQVWRLWAKSVVFKCTAAVIVAEALILLAMVAQTININMVLGILLWAPDNKCDFELPPVHTSIYCMYCIYVLLLLMTS